MAFKREPCSRMAIGAQTSPTRPPPSSTRPNARSFETQIALVLRLDSRLPAETGQLAETKPRPRSSHPFAACLVGLRVLIERGERNESKSGIAFGSLSRSAGRFSLCREAASVSRRLESSFVFASVISANKLNYHRARQSDSTQFEQRLGCSSDSSNEEPGERMNSLADTCGSSRAKLAVVRLAIAIPQLSPRLRPRPRFASIVICERACVCVCSCVCLRAADCVGAIIESSVTCCVRASVCVCACVCQSRAPAQIRQLDNFHI